MMYLVPKRPKLIIFTEKLNFVQGIIAINNYTVLLGLLFWPRWQARDITQPPKPFQCSRILLIHVRKNKAKRDDVPPSVDLLARQKGIYFTLSYLVQCASKPCLVPTLTTCDNPALVVRSFLLVFPSILLFNSCSLLKIIKFSAQRSRP